MSRSLQPVPAVELELFTNRFRALVDEMGEMLRRTALSVNIKERLDFSCALLDPAGRLVVNAPHIPVHLGSLGLCVRALRSEMEFEPGDVAVTNHPAFGGSHLPDVTVVTPVFGGGASSEKPELLGYVANRAHHAEMGGTRPGSMPPDATRLSEEGVVIPPLFLVRGGTPRWSEIAGRLSTGPFPSRSVEENLADLAAALAANRRGVEQLVSLAAEFGAQTLRRHMAALSRQATDALESALGRFATGSYSAGSRLDDGTPLRVRLDLAPNKLVIDFEGTGGVHPGNLNATPAITRSAVLYVLRLLIEEPLPLNEGLLDGVEVRIPLGLLNPEFGADPASSPAVVGGNVETSQRLVDTLLEALGVAACSQGTMNNILFGNESFAFYETVCGGAGATARSEGATAVHSHMTNTAITDPEILEHRYPVRLERFAVRRGSGGKGKHRGGDGVTRELLFLAPLSLSVLTQHRVEEPYGASGGGPGSRGSQVVRRGSGDEIALEPIDGVDVEPGDRLVLETPGG
ncbi:MAG: hydantoinase B/oxoprolinase family protein, partial [Acidobacteriota bacterium]|nr:hydantoinase B/oxoprolinase family protein [Acidobacteriota bacterium]